MIIWYIDVKMKSERVMVRVREQAGSEEEEGYQNGDGADEGEFEGWEQKERVRV